MGEVEVDERAPLLPRSELEGLWSPEGVYLNTASYGLAPRPTVEALSAVIDEWRAGRTTWEDWSTAVARARATFARMVGVDPDDVATGATISEFAGLVAASLPDGARVVVPEIEFTSNLFPWLAQPGRLDVVTVPLDALVDSIDGATTLVAVSAVQSSNGAVADLDAVTEAARAHDVLVFVDATQACGWLPLEAGEVDFLACHTYKWLVSPRGAAFFSVRRDRLDDLLPIHAGWWAGEDPYGSYYGLPLRLAESARRLDTSPAWFSWMGTEHSLRVLDGLGIDRIHAHNLALANRFRAGLGREPRDSAIVSAEIEGGDEKLKRAGIRAATRAGALRVSFHLYNTVEDVDATLDALRG